MRKIFLLLFCLICMLTACKQSNTPSNTQSGTISNYADSNATLSNQDETNNPYALHDISDERITTVETKKIFSDSGITVSVPVDWRCMEFNGEDGTSFFFRDPKLGEKCQFFFSVTGSEFLNERTEDEYLEYLSYTDRKDVRINSFAKETVSGYESTKVVSSYSSENTEFIRIDYDNVVVGFRLYHFTIAYPASESETFETVFESVRDSIEFTTAE